MADEFDFFSEPPKAKPKPKAPLPPRAEPLEDDDYEDEPAPRVRNASRDRNRRDRYEEPEREERPRYGSRAVDSKKKMSPLVIVTIIAGSVLVLGGGIAGIVLAVGGNSKPTEAKDKTGSSTTSRPDKFITPPKKESGDPNKPSDEVVERVRKASVYIRCAFKNGKGATGSGFVEKDSRLVVTNAHVVGLKDNKEKGPKAIELIFNSGEGSDKEYHYGGELVAYDRDHDLAILRPFLLDVGARQAVPEGIVVPKSPKLSILQKLFVFGYPLGESLGKEITVSETTISSLRKDPDTGKLKHIQVKGGINHGNSGGPLVDIKGNVIGVAVAGYDGTDIQLAIPGEVVQEFIAKHRE